MTIQECSYRWTFRAERGVSIEVEVRATNAINARRALSGFLSEHDGSDWEIESVSRGSSHFGPIPVPAPLESAGLHQGSLR